MQYPTMSKAKAASLVEAAFLKGMQNKDDNLCKALGASAGGTARGTSGRSDGYLEGGAQGEVVRQPPSRQRREEKRKRSPEVDCGADHLQAGSAEARKRSPDGPLLPLRTSEYDFGRRIPWRGPPAVFSVLAEMEVRVCVGTTRRSMDRGGRQTHCRSSYP